MKQHHLAWLSVHPERTEGWLKERLADGFDIHHMDGDHSNNDPANLVLIDGADHLSLHNGGQRVSRIQRGKAINSASEQCRAAYESYEPTNGWRGVSEALGMGPYNGDKVRAMAAKYAKATGAKWPLNNGRPLSFVRRPLGHHIRPLAQ